MFVFASWIVVLDFEVSGLLPVEPLLVVLPSKMHVFRAFCRVEKAREGEGGTRRGCGEEKQTEGTKHAFFTRPLVPHVLWRSCCSPPAQA